MSWEVLGSTTLLDRSPFVRVRQERLQLPDGRVIEDFYQVDLRPFALVVAVLENGQLRLIEQYKHGPRREVLGFPAGFIDPGEAPEEAAARELLEETGLRARSLIPLGSHVDNGNQGGCTGHYFLAEGCHPVAAPNPGDLEEFRYLDMCPEEIDAALLQGRFGVVHHVAGWGLYQAYRRSVSRAKQAL